MKIQEIMECAHENVQAAFQVPSPACWCQSLTIGKDPSMKIKMLDQLQALRKLPMDKVTETLQLAVEDISSLRLERARAAVNNFAACAGGQLNALDVVLVRARVAERSVQQGRSSDAPEVAPVEAMP